MKRYVSKGRKPDGRTQFGPVVQELVVYSEIQEVRCHTCGELLTAGERQLVCSSNCREYDLQPPINPGLPAASSDADRWLKERYLVDTLLRQGGGDREKVANEVKLARDEKLEKAGTGASGPFEGGGGDKEALREKAARIERVRVLVLED